MRKGCSENDISFANDIVSGYEHTPVVDDKCKVFHPDGGGATYVFASEKVFENGAVNWSYTGGIEVQDIGSTGGTGFDSNEVLALLSGIDSSACKNINNKAGIAGIPQGTVLDTGFFLISVINVNAYTTTGNHLIGDPGEGTMGNLRGHSFGCFQFGTIHNYYHVLLAR